ncbi:DUF4843 domain-containing protein [Pedobacter miscanthi]|uniref:DUF4843 domain-containing protein n=1 Tax=Pedobacter miscanthi TaxID=2259170 RepID=A0A366L344_9SPHI|nr:DUF4843 domain-containing protein [Pedobacter miscanthi]RBQ07899.1 DUF4843 domain-containing protein [Pedobacter miscanthi]
MKTNRLIYFILVCISLAVLAGCSKAELLVYTDIDRLQMTDTATINSTFVYEPASTIKDTVYIQVNTIGKTANFDREVKLVQRTEAGEPNPAVPGVHYLAMDDASLKSSMIVKANAVKAMIPVVLLRDPSLKANSYRLRLELVANAQFGLGEVQSRSVAIRFSDRLERFYSWRVDGSQAGAFVAFGKYSIRKHQFMIDVLQERIDDAWYQKAASISATLNYKNLLKQALVTYNNDPANIASGKAPMRETDTPGSPLVTFP